MTPLHPLELEWIIALQSWPGWGAWMEVLSHFGPSKYSLAVIGIIFVGIHPRLGLRLLAVYLAAEILSYLLKMGFHSPRPYWIDPRVVRFGPETKSFGFPSGHAFVGAAIWWTAAAHFSRAWLWLVAGVMIGLIALARVYLGVHFISDVVVGSVMGLGVGWAVTGPRPSWLERGLRRAGLWTWVWPAVGVVSLMVGGLLWVWVDRLSSEQRLWRPLSDSSRYLQALASFAGAAIGVGSGWQQAMRWGLEPWLTPAGPRDGLIRILRLAPVALAAWWCVWTGFPKEPAWVAVPLHFVAATMAGLGLMWGVPWLYRRWGLASTPLGGKRESSSELD